MADGSENTNTKNSVFEELPCWKKEFLFKEIVRCKDCKYAGTVGVPNFYLLCKRNFDVRSPEDFCSHGEKKYCD